MLKPCPCPDPMGDSASHEHFSKPQPESGNLLLLAGGPSDSILETIPEILLPPTPQAFAFQALGSSDALVFNACSCLLEY